MASLILPNCLTSSNTNGAIGARPRALNNFETGNPFHASYDKLPRTIRAETECPNNRSIGASASKHFPVGLYTPRPLPVRWNHRDSGRPGMHRKLHCFDRDKGHVQIRIGWIAAWATAGPDPIVANSPVPSCHPAICEARQAIKGSVTNSSTEPKEKLSLSSTCQDSPLPYRPM